MPDNMKEILSKMTDKQLAAFLRLDFSTVNDWKLIA